jgi:carbonic anhydrase
MVNLVYFRTFHLYQQREEPRMCDICKTVGSGLSHDPTRRHVLRFLAAAAASVGVPELVSAKQAKAPPKPQNIVSPERALELLREGNGRYIAGVSRRHDFKHEREALTGGQNPYAGVLSCADSRIAPEYAFDSGRGDLFVCRVAGNFANNDSIASFEYAVANLGVPLILVLGHESCGAIEATMQSLKDNVTLPGHLPSLVTALAPAVKASAQQSGDPETNAIRQNVIDNVAALKSATPILADAVSKGKLMIVGGIYQLGTGKVAMLD